MTQKVKEKGGVVTDTKHEVEFDKLYKVLLHNDDKTTMEFVVDMLITIFHHSEVVATQIMLNVHQKGIGVAGVFVYEIAETKAEQAMRQARQYGFPLQCSVEPD